MPSPYDTYSSPLASRNASPEMLRLWSPRHKFNTWRHIWLAVAEAMCEMGGAPPEGRGARPRSGRVALVTREQVVQLRAVVERTNPDGTIGITDEDIRLAEKYERDLRHDVMAHVHALGDACPQARPIIHLGMTSQDVVCNADLLTFYAAMDLINRKAVRCILDLGDFAGRYRSLPALGFTHYQPAQPLTVGRRAAAWAWELSIANGFQYCFNEFLRMKGLRGATGTQASYLALFDGDGASADELERRVMQLLTQRLYRDHAWSFDEAEGVEADVHGPVGQTYPRIVDQMILSCLGSMAAVLHKIATDIRLLSNRKELDEPFEATQIGSSAMPYKRNPMRCERICGLTRFVMNLVGNTYDTAATQWLERTLDDSSNRRLTLPEAFLALDGALDLMHNVVAGSDSTGGLIVHEAMVRKNLMAELPFMATENILMACVRAGGDRQEYHEKIRVHAQAAGWRVKHEGLDNDLLDRLKSDPAFRSKSHAGPLLHDLDWSEGQGGLLDPARYIGRSVEQTERFLTEVIEPLREQYQDSIKVLGHSAPKV